MSNRRAAIVRGGRVSGVASYLPANYTARQVDEGVLIEGRDVAGWTLTEYVIPRLASGWITAQEIAVRQEDDEPTYPAPGSAIPPERNDGQDGYVVGVCGHRVAGQEWRAGFRTCERCPDSTE